MTHTYVLLDVHRTVYAAVRALLAAADYGHAFHAEIAMSAVHRLHVIADAGDVEVWLDVEDGDCVGICLGHARTHEEALVQARVELAHALEKVDQHIARLKHSTGESRSQWEGGAS